MRLLNKTTLTLALACAALGSVAVACGDSGGPTAGGGGAPAAPKPSGQPARTRPPLPEKYKGMTSAFAGKPEAVEAGKALYNGKGTCVSCHGPLGDGNTPTGKSLVPPAGNLADVALHQLGTPYLFFRITEGSPGTGMTPYDKQLSDNERWQLAEYIMTLK